MTTVAGALREATALLAETSDTARLDAELLMAHALGMSRSDMLLRAADRVAPLDFSDMVERRARHEPVAYIIGSQEFYGLDFLVTQDVLIPRPDSETIVQAALDHARDHAREMKRVLDCGTGSGALLLAVLAHLPQAEGIGIDRSLAALPVAAANAARLGLADRVHMLSRDWREAGWTEGLGRFDLVIANPPYVESEAKLDASVREYEPAAALFAGTKGLDDYRILIPQLRGLLTENGIVILEIGHEQAQSVAALAEKQSFSTVLRRDLAGRPRALILS